jgi:hypothetical protein
LGDILAQLEVVMSLRIRPVLAVLGVLILAANPAVALDYNIPRAFDTPIGTGQGEEWHFGDVVVYRADTGEVTYPVDAVGTSYTSWWPPDFASRSGVLLFDPEPPAESPYGKLEQLTDVVIDGAVVPFSNSSWLQYDGYSNWPFSTDDPKVLANWGPFGMPYSFKYGKILPAGLSESFLRSDIYSFPHVDFVYVAPEPSCCGLALL